MHGTHTYLFNFTFCENKNSTCLSNLYGNCSLVSNMGQIRSICNKDRVKWNVPFPRAYANSSFLRVTALVAESEQLSWYGSTRSYRQTDKISSCVGPVRSRGRTVDAMGVACTGSNSLHIVCWSKGHVSTI